MQEINSNQTKANLHVDDGGMGGIPILFLHSFGGSSLQWDAQLHYFRKYRRAVAIDLPAHGSSPVPENGSYSITGWAEEVNQVTEEIKLDKFVLAGHSMGGSTAIAFAAKYPEKVSGLVLEGTPGKLPNEQVDKTIAALESDQYEAVMDQYMQKLLADARPATEENEMDGMNKLSKENILKIIKASFDYDPVPDLKLYEGPVLIIGKQSDTEPGSLHSLFPSLPFKMFEGTSHWIQMDKPDQFNNTLDAFVRRIELA